LQVEFGIPVPKQLQALETAAGVPEQDEANDGIVGDGVSFK
jgi:hypothetical protein